MKAFWHGCADFIAQRHWWLLAGAAVATVAFAFGIPRLEFKTSQDTIVSSSSEVYQTNVRFERQFGGEPVLVLFTGNDILHLLTPPNLEQLSALERELRETGLYHAVLGPIMALEFARDQIPVAAELAPAALARHQDAAAQLAREQAAAGGAGEAEQEEAAGRAREEVAEAFAERNAADATRLAAAGERSLENPAFVEFLILGQDGEIRPEFEGLFPDRQHALMVVRLNGNQSIDEQGEAASRVIEIAERHEFEGFEVLPSGPAILLKEINDSMRDAMLMMAVLAISIMVVVLFLVFRARWRLLSLAVVLVGSVWAFGLMGYVGIPLTMVTISGLPILIGLGVDFAIQLHSRFEEETQRTGSALGGMRSTLANLGPALSIAVIAATTGFLVLHISRVPMIRDFGSMLAVGTVILFLCVVFFLGSLLYARDRRRRGEAPARPARMEVERVVRALASSADGRVIPIVALGIAFVLIGLWAEQRVEIQSDPERFVPSDSAVLRDLNVIRDVAGSSNQLDILIEADDVTRPEVIAWIDEFTDRQVRNHPAELKRAESIVSITERIVGATPTTEEIETIASVAPPAIQDSFLSDDRTQAHIIFAIAPISLSEQEKLVEQMKADLNAPPEVSASSVGLAAVGIEAVHALAANRLILIYAALGVKLAWFLLIFRSLVRTALALLPIVIAVGSSSAAIYLFDIELNPLTTLSGPLVIAVAVEFSVLIMARYYEERGRGLSPREAIDMASTRIGRAITASGLTTIGGFGVLAFSGFPLLTSFGIVTAMNIGIALLGTLIILPSLLVWADEEELLVPVREDLRPAE
jgi:hypothetical protein